MFRIVKIALAAVLLVTMVTSATAEDARGFKAYKKSAPFEDVYVDLQNAIIGKGLVIDYVGHIDQMLNRTSKIVNSVTQEGSKSPYLAAKFMQFCSAKLSHEVISANPQNIAICPYVVFVYELKNDPGVVHVGYRRPITGPSKLSRKVFAKIEKLLDDVAKEAIE